MCCTYSTILPHLVLAVVSRKESWLPGLVAGAPSRCSPFPCAPETVSRKGVGCRNWQLGKVPGYTTGSLNANGLLPGLPHFWMSTRRSPAGRLEPDSGDAWYIPNGKQLLLYMFLSMPIICLFSRKCKSVEKSRQREFSRSSTVSVLHIHVCHLLCHLSLQGPSLLPQWLAQPRLVQRQIKENLTSFEEVPLIHPKLVKKMQANGIESLFPVQAEVIPVILESVSNGFLAGRGGYRPSDICVSAPTGSGKTLAFVIPVVQALLDRVVCQVRALAVLPTKELAQQVSKVFNVYTDGLGLKVVQLTGQKSFAKEQESLVERTLTGFRSLADIVVATPGRLVDHLQQSPQFSLRELRFLIIDEADRIIDSMQQDWLQQVTKAACHSEEEMGPIRLFRQVGHGLPITAARSCCPYLPLQKLLFSATLTWNPEKLQQLGLYQPCLFMPVSSEKQAEVQQEPEKKYTIPEGLSQYYVPCSLSWKPLFLLHFLLRLKFSRVLCFTNSKDTSHRLFLLIRAFGGVNVAEFSSRLSPSQRKRTLKEFEQGKIQLLISTDATARGIDIVGVKCVISYDAPQFIRTYIHRVGRTARAGKAGLAFTMLLKQQRKFLKMLRDAGLPKLEQQLVKSKFIQPLLQPYQEALAELQQIVKEEQAEKRS
uniref:ATP-dependent RNA helicase n=1 Tax=Varanus komodoensis TaxID=61221 RepID=A0A8D2JL16_VARKO